MQTPQFSFSTYATEEDPRTRPALGSDLEGVSLLYSAQDNSLGLY